MVSNSFDLQRETASERVHLSVEEYKQITNFENFKTVLTFTLESQIKTVEKASKYEK